MLSGKEGMEAILSKSSFTGCTGVAGLVNGDIFRFVSLRLFLKAIGVLTALEGEQNVSLKQKEYKIVNYIIFILKLLYLFVVYFFKIYVSKPPAKDEIFRLLSISV